MTGVADSPLASKADASVMGGLDANSVHGRSSVAFAIFNFTKTMVGAGVFTAPHAMLISGYFALIVLLILATVIIYLTCGVIMNLGIRYNCRTYRSVCASVIGKWGGVSEAVASFLLTFGAMVSYSLIIADSLPPLFIQLTGWTEAELLDQNSDVPGISVPRTIFDRRIMLMLASFLIIYPLMLLPDVHFLSYSSLFGLFCFLLIAISLSQRALTMPEDQRGTLTGGSLLSIVIPSGVPNAISRSAFMNVCQHAQFLIFNSLEKNTNRNRNVVILSSLTLSTVLVITFATLTYLPLNDKIVGNIFNSFPNDDVLVNVCRLALSFHIIASCPLQGHVCRTVTHSLVHGEGKPMNAKRRIIHSTVIFLAAWVIAMLVCDLGVVVDLSGGIAAGTLAFVLPALMWIVTAYRDQVRSKVRYIPCGLLLVGGVVLVFYTIINEIYVAVTSTAESRCVYRFL